MNPSPHIVWCSLVACWVLSLPHAHSQEPNTPPPVWSIAQLHEHSGLDRGVVRRVFRLRSASINTCAPKHTVRLRLKMILDTHGKVLLATSHDPNAPPELTHCIIQHVKTWTFPTQACGVARLDISIQADPQKRP